MGLKKRKNSTRGNVQHLSGSVHRNPLLGRLRGREGEPGEERRRSEEVS